MEGQPIASTFSAKSDAILSEIITQNKLDVEIATYVLTKLTMYFARQEISEQEMVTGIQNELKTTAQTAATIAEGLKKIIPTLWNHMPEEERKALLGEDRATSLPKKSMSFPGASSGPAFLNVEDNAKLLHEDRESAVPPTNPNTTPQKSAPPKTFQEPAIEEGGKLPKKSLVQNQPKKSGPDKYREEVI